MSFAISRPLTALLVGIGLVSSALAGTNPHINVRPQARITQKIDNNKTVAVPNSHPARISTLPDGGRVAGSTQFKHMMLVLKSSDAQEYALHSLLDQQQDKTSPNYHQWATPASFGGAFGAAAIDIAQITAWLQNAGFSVDSVAPNGRIISFSGNSGQVEAAFHTEMHQYVVNGETRISNATDISIPAALSPVVIGPAALNNFRPHAAAVNPRTVKLAAGTKLHAPGTPGSPQFTGGDGSHYVGASDFATIYNTQPLLNAGNDGTGVKVALLGETDILLSDVQTYRRLFNLPQNDPNFVQVGGDPGTVPGDDGESDLDVEIAGGIAPNATIDFVTGDISLFGAGIETAMEYVVENNSDDIMSLSYGECEYGLGAGGNAFFNAVWEEAASQGQTVFVSTGDGSVAGCDNDNTATYSKDGYAVNGFASTPFNVAVGGTMFGEGTTDGATQYWSGDNSASYGSALSYIPEIPWNESYFDPYGAYSPTNPQGGFGPSIVGGGSGVSSYYATPSFQTGPGVPTTDPTLPVTKYNTPVVAGPHRYLPDVSLNAAADHDGTIYCSEGSCELDDQGDVLSAGVVGGTSVSAPSMAGVQALINQANGGRQGNANYYYYRVAAAQSETACNSATYVTSSGPACGFHDVQTGNNNIPSNAADTTEIGFTAAPGYDLAIGLGSPDVSNLAALWSTVSFTATTTTFTLTPTTSAHGATYNYDITVAPTTGTGTPTGDASIIAEATYGGFGPITLSGGTNSGTLTGLPGGTYNVYAHYAGDTTFGASDSAPIQVVIGTEAPTVVAATFSLTPQGQYGQTATFTYGTNVYIEAGVGAPSGTGIPSGNVTFTLNNGTANLPPYTTNLDPNGTTIGTTNYPAGAFFDAGLGLAADGIPSTYPLLAPGTYMATVAYAGDQTFTAATSAPITFVVGKAATTITLTVASAEIASGGTATLTATVPTLSAAVGGVPATGAVVFTDTTTGVTLATANLVNGTVTIMTNLITKAGANSITAAYAGDNNYAAKTSTAATVTVGGTASSVTLATTTPTVPVGTSISFTATVPLQTTGTAYVYFYDGTTYLGRATISNTTHIATYTIGTLTAGPHSITGVYNGTATLDSSTSNAVPVTVTQNQPTISLTGQSQNATGNTISFSAVFTPTPLGTQPANPAPTGTIEFLDGTTVLGTAPLVYLGGSGVYVAQFTTATLKPGVHAITAQYLGDTNYAPTTSNVNTVGVGLTTTTVSSSTSNVGTGILFTLTANVTAQVPSKNAITGTVTFYDGMTVIGSAPVMAGVATLTTASLQGVGTHVVTAVYLGDANFYTSTSATGVTIVTETPAFAITVNPTSLTITRGGSGTATITATAVGNYNGFANLSCSGLPAGTYCSFSQPAILFAGDNGSSMATVTITTLAPGVSIHTGGLLWIPAMLLAGFLGLRRKQLSLRGRQLLVFTLLFCGMMAASGCGSGSRPGTPTGTSTVTIVASGNGVTSASPNSKATATIALTVQ